MIKKLLYMVVCVLFTHTTLAQTLTGKVVDETNQPLPYVHVKSEQGNTLTNYNGEYGLNITDSCTITFSFIGFKKQTIKTGKGVLNVVMVTEAQIIGEVTVKSKKNNASETVLLLERKKLVGIESSIGGMEMSKKGISNAEDGLKKLTSITFSNSRLNVRGLDDRYNQITLNGIPIPSNNSDRKNIDLSILPLSVIDNIKVKKTYSSEQWSNVAGAQINITTPNVRKHFTVNYKGSFNTLTPTPNSSLNISFGNNKLKKFGLLVNFNLNQDNQNTNGVIRLANKQGNSILDYNFTEKLQQLTPSAIMVLDFNHKDLEVSNTTLFINQNSKSYRTTLGSHFDYNTDLFTIRITPTNHNLFTEQIKFELKKDKFEIRGIGGLSLVNSGENGRNQFVYLYDGNYQFNNVDKLDNHFFWSQNKESRINLGLTGKYHIRKTLHEFGYSYMITNNYFNYQQEYYDLLGVNNENVSVDPNNPFMFINGENSESFWVNNPASEVNGVIRNHSGYYKSDFNNDKIDLSFGSRFEKIYQLVEYKDQLSPVFTKYSILDNFEILPYLNVKYKITNKLQLRGSGAVTTIRPRFREMTPFIYTEVFAGSKIQGNPNLINSTVYNGDLNLEFYPSKTEIVSFTMYYKLIKNPIEKVNVATASGRLETYQNSLQSMVYGGEFDFKKSIKNFKFDFNSSYLYSNITTSENTSSSVVVTNINRPLQGSSKFMTNFDVFYMINKNNNIGIVYNYVGTKLNSVGVFGLGDIYQTPQHFVNMVYNINKDKFVMSFRINNLFNTEYKLQQMTDIGLITTNSYRTGQEFSVRFGYKL